MAIGARTYSLPRRGHDALRSAAVGLVEELHRDLETLAQGDVHDTYAVLYLPPKYSPSYDLAFLRRFLACVTVVGWKLLDPEREHRLACLAEELALFAILQRAACELEARGAEPVDFDAVSDTAFEDMDFETLFDPALDGIEDTPSGKYLRMTHLKLREWFQPFRPESDVVHPFAEEDAVEG